MNREEAIDNANPSEALECLMYLKAEFRNYPSAYEAIKQALLKEQRQENVLEIINNIIKFGDDLNSILDFDTYEEYSEHSDGYDYDLSQEEFVLLRRYLNDSRVRD